MIKILILTPFLSLSGGVSDYVKLLTKELNGKNFQIKYLEVGKTGIFKKDIFYPLLIFIQFLRLNRFLKSYKPDIVHLNPSLAYGAIFRDFIFLKRINKQGCSILLFIHGWKENISKKFDNIFFKIYFRKRFDTANAIVVLANQFKKKLVKLGINENKIYVSSTMIDTKKYNINNKIFLKPYMFLICTNMIKEKGIFELIEAAPMVLKKYKDSKFIFMGDGKDLKKLKRKTKKMGLEKNIVFTGYLNGKEKIDFFKKSHIFVLPSYTEGFPIVALEAMACGLPLIITSVGGIADFIIDSKHGFLLKTMPPSSNEIAEKIIQLLEHPDLIKKISEYNMIEAKEKYDVKLVSKQIASIYNNIK